MELFTSEAVLIANLREEHLSDFLALRVVCVAISITKSVVNDAEDVAPWLGISLLEQNGFKGHEQHQEEQEHGKAFSGKVHQKEVDGVV